MKVRHVGANSFDRIMITYALNEMNPIYWKCQWSKHAEINTRQKYFQTTRNFRHKNNALNVKTDKRYAKNDRNQRTFYLKRKYLGLNIVEGSIIPTATWVANLPRIRDPVLFKPSV